MTDGIVVVGDVMVDVVVVPDGPLAHGSDTPSAIRALGGGLGRQHRLLAGVAGPGRGPGGCGGR